MCVEVVWKDFPMHDVNGRTPALFARFHYLTHVVYFDSTMSKWVDEKYRRYDSFDDVRDIIEDELRARWEARQEDRAHEAFG